MKAYENLKERFAHMSKLGHAAEILSKDAETAMPSGSGAARVEQISAISMAAYHLMTDPHVEEWLNDAEAGAQNLSKEDRRNLELMRHSWVHEASLPSDLAKEMARLEPLGEQMHVAHYKSGDWSKVKEGYEQSFKIAKEAAQAKMDKLGVASEYEALVDAFSPGIRVATIEKELADLDKALRQLIPLAIERQNKAGAPRDLKGPFSDAKQMKLNHYVAKMLGFDYDRGVLYNIKGHPSTGGAPDDSRITTRCEKSNFLPSLYATAHEAGHAMYDQNLPLAHRYQPLGGALGMAIHESQSMVIELQACGTEEFITHIAKKANDVFGKDPSLSPGNLRKILHQVAPSFIRVEADELTYPMHVILRFELEKAIIEGTLDVKDLPEAWNEAMRKKLGIMPPSHAQGCMQDIHWPVGAIGYFPAYTLGAMTAAQFFAKACEDTPDLKKEIAKGNFKPLTNWLHDNVHSQGSILKAEDMIKQATGEGLNAKYYLNHFRNRYLG